jgi:hypothetical protein
MTPAVVMRPILAALFSENQRAPSGPETIPEGQLSPEGIGNSVTPPCVVTRASRPAAMRAPPVATPAPPLLPQGHSAMHRDESAFLLLALTTAVCRPSIDLRKPPGLWLAPDEWGGAPGHAIALAVPVARQEAAGKRSGRSPVELRRHSFRIRKTGRAPGGCRQAKRPLTSRAAAPLLSNQKESLFATIRIHLFMEGFVIRIDSFRSSALPQGHSAMHRDESAFLLLARRDSSPRLPGTIQSGGKRRSASVIRARCAQRSFSRRPVSGVSPPCERPSQVSPQRHAWLPVRT